MDPLRLEWSGAHPQTEHAHHIPSPQGSGNVMKNGWRDFKRQRLGRIARKEHLWTWKELYSRTLRSCGHYTRTAQELPSHYSSTDRRGSKDPTSSCKLQAVMAASGVKSVFFGGGKPRFPFYIGVLHPHHTYTHADDTN